MMAKTAVLSALYNVKINLISIKDNKFKDKISERVNVLETKVQRREKELLSTVNIKIYSYCTVRFSAGH